MTLRLALLAAFVAAILAAPARAGDITEQPSDCSAKHFNDCPTTNVGKKNAEDKVKT